MKKPIFLVVVMSFIFLLNGCGDRGKKVLAKINDRIITMTEFEKRIDRLPRHYQEIIKGQEKKFLEEIIKEELLHMEALKSNVEKDPETQEVIAEAKKKILIARLIKNRVEDKASVSEEDIRKYYDERSEEFLLPERWRASHILVDTQGEAEEIKEKLNQGASFEELAENRSKDATAKQGGDIGYFSKGQIVPEFENACFDLEVTEISGVVKTQFGYHIIKLTEKKSPEVQEFSKVGEIIKRELEKEQKRQLLDELITGLQNNAKIFVDEELINQLTEKSKEAKKSEGKD